MATSKNPPEQFEGYVSRLPPETRAAYERCKHNRIEFGLLNRQFVVYRINDEDEPEIIDVLTVKDIEVDLEHGATFALRSRARKEVEFVGYSPVDVFGYPVFMHLPLHLTLRWDLKDVDDPSTGVLAFPIVVRTKSRFHLREPGVTYVEAMPTFAREFGSKLMA